MVYTIDAAILYKTTHVHFMDYTVQILLTAAVYAHLEPYTLRKMAGNECFKFMVSTQA
jgi:hypothetical protein